MSRYSRVSLLAGAVVCASVATAPFAHADGARPLPSGIYGHATCERPDHVWVVAAGLDLVIFEDDYSIYEHIIGERELVHDWRFCGDFDVFGYSFVRMSPEGAIEWISWSSESEEAVDDNEWIDVLPANVEDIEDGWDIAIYEPCGTLPAAYSPIHVEPVGFLLDLDTAAESCMATDTDCLSDIFSALDKYHDNELTTAELSRLFRTAAYIGVAAASEFSSAETDEAVAAMAAVVVAAPLMANLILSNYDYDGNGLLSIDEFRNDTLGEYLFTLDSSDGRGIGALLMQGFADNSNNLQRWLDALLKLARLFGEGR